MPARLGACYDQGVLPGHASERPPDVFSMLLDKRLVYLRAPISDEVANTLVAQLLYLAQADAEREIALYVNSPGGNADAGLVIYDALHAIPAPVATTCVGTAGGAAALVLAGGARGRRSALPNARVRLYQPAGGVEGTAARIEVHAREIARRTARLIELLAADTGQHVEPVARDLEREAWMSAQDALAYGLIDRLVER